jgi:branched-subunit amino acid ABC-type transport system permease component
MKTQLIRLIDVLALGPFMIYAASQPLLTRGEKTMLAAIGVATILYNLVNYLNERERDL